MLHMSRVNVIPNNAAPSFTTATVEVPRVLVLSDLYPRPRQPVLGIFVEEQSLYLRDKCHQVVVSPTRTFPPLRIFRAIPSRQKFTRLWQQWREELDSTPAATVREQIPVYYPRYNSPPKHLSYGLWGWFAYPFIRKLLRRLHREHQFNLIHAHGVAPAGRIALLAQRWMNVPVVVSEHGIDVQYIVHLNRWCEAEVRDVFRQADMVLANSQQTVKDVVHYGANPDRVQLVYLGTHRDTQFPRTSVPSVHEPIHLLSVARLVEEKGIQWVLHAMQRLINRGFSMTYTVVGDGDYRPYLEELALRLGIADKVTFTGSQSRSAVLAHFSACDIFVLPSKPEAFGIVFVEALSKGKPVVGWEGSGASDLQTYYADGVELVKAEDSDSIVAALQRFIEDPARRQRVQHGGAQLIEERFTWERTADETFALYNTLINSGSGQMNAKSRPRQ